MKQTPIHDVANIDLLRLVPITSKNLIEIGCSSGAFAREYKSIVPESNFTGVEIDPDYAELAKRYCDSVLVSNVDLEVSAWFQQFTDRDCWIFADVLEHFKDPWAVLRNIRTVIPNNGCVVACIPNVQYWCLVAKLAIGDFRYTDMGLLDRTHLRWFTRQTIIELFEGCGFRIDAIAGRYVDDPTRDNAVWPLIGKIAEACGYDPKVAMEDARVYQYLLRAVPV